MESKQSEAKRGKKEQTPDLQDNITSSNICYHCNPGKKDGLYLKN